MMASVDSSLFAPGVHHRELDRGVDGGTPHVTSVTSDVHGELAGTKTKQELIVNAIQNSTDAVVSGTRTSTQRTQP